MAKVFQNCQKFVTLGVKFDLIQKAGSWYSINGEKIGQGQEAVKEYFANNPKIAEEIENKIKAIASSADSINAVDMENSEQIMDASP